MVYRNGIIAKPMRVELDGRNTGEAILATAQSLGVRPAYQGCLHAEPIAAVDFGGATQHVLGNAACRFAGELTQRLVPSLPGGR